MLVKDKGTDIAILRIYATQAVARVSLPARQSAWSARWSDSCLARLSASTSIDPAISVRPTPTDPFPSESFLSRLPADMDAAETRGGADGVGAVVATARSPVVARGASRSGRGAMSDAIPTVPAGAPVTVGETTRRSSTSKASTAITSKAMPRWKFSKRRAAVWAEVGRWSRLPAPANDALHTAGLLEQADAGEVFIDRTPTSALSDGERTRIRRRSRLRHQAHHLWKFSAIECSSRR